MSPWGKAALARDGEDAVEFPLSLGIPKRKRREGSRGKCPLNSVLLM